MYIQADIDPHLQGAAIAVTEAYLGVSGAWVLDLTNLALDRNLFA